MTTASRVLEALRASPLQDTRVVPDPLPAPEGGSVLLRVERFVLTSNNVTYALNGDVLGYWAAFPAGEEGWGRVPAWGTARVVDGDPALGRPGDLFFGYVPMATHVLLAAEPRPGGLRATAPGRAGMLPLYRDMARVDDLDDADLTVRPGLSSAAHLDDELRATSPAQIVLSSATSRTALHTAVLLHRAGVRVVGLTAPQRTGAAARAGVYDRVLAYDDVAGLDVVAGTVYADVAGRPEITAAVHRTLGTSLARSVRVGGTHAAAGTTPDPTPPPGPAIERFNVGQRRLDVAARRGEAALATLERAAQAPIAAWAAEHTTVERVPGLERAQDAWRRTWRGETDPFTAVVVAPSAG